MSAAVKYDTINVMQRTEPKIHEEGKIIEK
jgi:hypothetical protein